MVRRPVTVVRVTLHRQLATGRRPQGTLRRRNPITPRRRAIGRLRLHRRLGLRLHRTAKRPCTPPADRTRSCFAMVRPGKIRASSSASPRTTPNCLRLAKSTFRTPTRSDRSRLQVRRRCLRVVVSLLPRHRLGTSRNSALQADLEDLGSGPKRGPTPGSPHHGSAAWLPRGARPTGAAGGGAAGSSEGIPKERLVRNRFGAGVERRRLRFLEWLRPP
jgi:hypothetical protein